MNAKRILSIVRLVFFKPFLSLRISSWYLSKFLLKLFEEIVFPTYISQISIIYQIELCRSMYIFHFSVLSADMKDSLDKQWNGMCTMCQIPRFSWYDKRFINCLSMCMCGCISNGILLSKFEEFLYKERAVSWGVWSQSPQI